MGHPTHYFDFKAILGLKSVSGPQVHGSILNFMGLVPKTNPMLTAHCPKAPLGTFSVWCRGFATLCSESRYQGPEFEVHGRHGEAGGGRAELKPVGGWNGGSFGLCKHGYQFAV